jgi:hypothetical protein
VAVKGLVHPVGGDPQPSPPLVGELCCHPPGSEPRMGRENARIRCSRWDGI